MSRLGGVRKKEEESIRKRNIGRKGEREKEAEGQSYFFLI